MSFKGFTKVRLSKPERSEFDMTHEKKLTANFGQLIPIFVSETLPNDTFKVDSEVMLRLAPMLAPIMHHINVFVHYFFVPNRLLWSQWETFITGGRLGTEWPAIQPPRMGVRALLELNQNILGVSSLADYMGAGANSDVGASTWTPDRTIDIMPFLAYQKIWMDYYRDRNFVADNFVNLPLTSSGTITAQAEFLRIRTRSWNQDYFTSALPWTQRGNAVLMPMNGSGTVTYMPNSRVLPTNGAPIPTGVRNLDINSGGLNQANLNAAAFGQVRIENIDAITVNSSGVPINELRRAVRLQEWFERNAVAGSRYNESIMAHFGRKTSDSRLQRAEFLGGGRVPVQISEVVNTAWSNNGTTNIPPGNMAGHGISFGKSNYTTYNCEEHGFVIGIMSIMPRADYFQGINRMFTTRRTFLDYPWPTFAHLGEQEVFTSELFMDNSTMNPNNPTVFGFQSRYADWKHIPNTVHGQFRSTLQFWHMARVFANAPVLGQAFNTFDTALPNRCFAVANQEHAYVYINNRCRVVRSLPYFGTPML